MTTTLTTKTMYQNFVQVLQPPQKGMMQNILSKTQVMMVCKIFDYTMSSIYFHLEHF